MNLKPFPTAAWLTVSLLTFGLGWIVKPDQEPGLTGGSGPVAGGATRFNGPGSRASSAAGAPGGRAHPAGESNGGVGARRALDQAAIEALGRQFKEDPDPISRRSAFSKMLEGLTVENAREIRAQVEHLPAGSPEFNDFHYAWGKIGGMDAVLNGADTPKPDMEATLAGWASADPAAAMEWFSSLEGTGDKRLANRTHLKMGLVQGLAITDSAKATSFVFGMAAAGDKQAEQMLGVVTGKMLQTKGPAGAAAWAETLPSGPLRISAMDRVAHDFAKSDPQAAAAWAAGFTKDDSSGRVVGAISNEWARLDGAAAVGWLESLNNAPAKSTAYYSAFEGWVGKDPMAASKYLVAMPASPAKDQAIGGLVSRHRLEDPVAALAWAGQISDARTRNSSLVSAGQAYFRRDPVAAQNWLANSGLSPEVRAKVMAPR